MNKQSMGAVAPIPHYDLTTWMLYNKEFKGCKVVQMVKHGSKRDRERTKKQHIGGSNWKDPSFLIRMKIRTV